MTLKECYAIENDCYKARILINKGKPTGIVVHSTGCNNKNLKRYVQPVKGQDYYDEVIKDLGKNTNGNSWNQAKPGGKRICCHAFIGVNAAGKVETYQILPWIWCCWNCASGPKGSYNLNPTAHIQFEIQEDALTDANYFANAMKEAQELCAYLCKCYDLDVSTIVSHKEAHALGYASNHGDPENWLSKFGKDMKWFRKEVQAILDKDKKKDESVQKPTTTTTTKPTTSKPATTTETKSNFKAGDAITLNKTNLYSSASTNTPSNTKTGTYYVWSDAVVNGRIRITNSKSNVGKTGQVTGFVNVNDIKLATGSTTSTVTNTTSNTLKVGDKIKILSGAVYTTGSKVPAWVRLTSCYVRAISGNNITFSIRKTGAVTGVVNKKYIKKV